MAKPAVGMDLVVAGHPWFSGDQSGGHFRDRVHAHMVGLEGCYEGLGNAIGLYGRFHGMVSAELAGLSGPATGTKQGTSSSPVTRSKVLAAAWTKPLSANHWIG